MNLSIFTLIIIAFTAGIFAANITSCTVIGAPGTYTLAGNLFANTSANCITVNSSGVDIDCAGFRMTNAKPHSGAGIYSSNANTTIRNCKVMNFSKGIYFNGTSGGMIKNTTVRVEASANTAESAGITLANGAKYTTIDNTSSYAYFGIGGIYLTYGTSNTIKASKGESLNGRGIQMAFSSNNLVVDSEGASNAAEGIRIVAFSSNNTILRSRGSSAMSSGIGIEAYFGNVNNKVVGSNGSSTYGKGIAILSSNGNQVENSTGSSQLGYGIYLKNADNNRITKSSGLARKNIGMYIDYGSDYNAISKCTIKNNETYSALRMYNASFNTLEGCVIDGVNGQDAVNIGDHSRNNTIANSTIRKGANGYAVHFQAATGYASGNRMINNTINGTGGLLVLGARAGNNIFCWNNFTATPGKYVNDSNGSNAYNSSLCNGEGNIYANAMNGSVKITGAANSTGFPGLYVGTEGAGYPYSNNTSQGKIMGKAIDYAPLTNAKSNGYGCLNLSEPNTAHVMSENASISGSTCFYISAPNVTLDCAGHSIASLGGNGYGVYSDQISTTIRNCKISNFQYNIYFKGASNGSITNTTALSSIYGSMESIRLHSSSGNRIVNSTGATDAYPGIYIQSGSDNNQIIDSYGASGSNAGILISESLGNQVVNSTGASETGRGIHLAQSTGSQIIGSAGTSNYNVPGTSYEGYGIFVFSSTNNTIINSVGTSISDRGIALINSSSNQLIGSTGTSETGQGIMLLSSMQNVLTDFAGNSGTDVGIYMADSRGNTLVNSTGTSNAAYGIHIDFDSNNTKIINSAGYAAIHGIYMNRVSNNTIVGSAGIGQNGCGIAMELCTNNIISNSTWISDSYVGICLYYHSSYNTITGSKGAASGPLSIGLGITSNSNGNIIKNNTLSAENTLVRVDDDASTNVFCWNNFTEMDELYVRDLNGSNFYNSSACNGEGNIWPDVMDGSVVITGTANSTGFPGLFVGDSAYTNASSVNRIIGNVSDYAPLTANTVSCLAQMPLTQADIPATLDCAGTTYLLQEDVGSGETALTVSAENVTIECDGHSVAKIGQPTQYGVYSNQHGTTVSNCRISGFETGVYYSYVKNGLVAGTTATATSHAIWINGMGSNTIYNSNGNSTSGGDGIRISYSNQNAIINSTGYGYDPIGGITLQNTFGTFINNSRGISELGGAGIYMGYGSNNTLANSEAASGLAYGMILSHSSGNRAYGNHISSGMDSALFLVRSSSNKIYNNTLASPQNTLLHISSGESNTFYQNNFTATSGQYISGVGSSAGNRFNTTINGKGEGNIYANVMDGSVQVQGSVPSQGFPLLYIGTNGTGYPYSAATSQGKLGEDIVDYAPLTRNYAATSKARSETPDAEAAPLQMIDEKQEQALKEDAEGPAPESGIASLPQIEEKKE